MRMYAVIATGGKQYRVAAGDVIRVEKLDAEAGSTITFDKVLMVGEGDASRIGQPFLDGETVSATVRAHGRGDKIDIIKFKRRKNYRRHMGHRQDYTEVEITAVAGKASPKKAVSKKTAKKAPAKKAAASKVSKKVVKKAAKKAPAKKAAAKTTKKTASKKAAKKTKKKAARKD